MNPPPWFFDPHYVYEFYAADGTCLYVGCTRHLTARLQTHTKKTWWHEVAHIQITTQANVAEGHQVEKDRIQLLNPIHNRMHTDRNTNGWATRRARQAERHEQGLMCSEGSGCSQCTTQRESERKEIIRAVRTRFL